jgi:autotransporter-associated beta strand protein
LLSGGSANAITNAVEIRGDFAFGGFNNLALNGLIALGADSAHAIDVVVPTVALTLGGVVSGSNDLVKTGLGNLVLGNVGNTYTGRTVVQGGILNVSTLRDGGLPSSVGASSGSATNLVLDGGALNYNGVTASTDRLITLGAAGGVIDVSSAVPSDTLTFASTGAVAYAGTGARTLVLKGGTTGTSVFNPLIGDAGSDAVSVAKGGPGSWMLGSATLHVVLSYLFNFTWCNTDPNAIDGGPLGFLSWTIPAMLGTFACDWFVPSRSADAKPIVPSRAIGLSVITACLLMLLGYAFSCATRFYDVASASENGQTNALVLAKIPADPVVPDRSRVESKIRENTMMAWLAEPPFVKPPSRSERQWNYWMMSQRAGTLSYLTFAAGFSLAIFVLFYVLCDLAGAQLPIFKTFGTNALAAYVLHDLVSNAVQPFFPKDSPMWYAYSGLGLFCLITWLFLRSLQRQNIFLRV